MNWVGDVYQRDRLVARLARTGSGSELHFKDTAIRDRPEPGYLALTLPYQTDPIQSSGINLPNYFLNLLPEGLRLQVVMEAKRIAKDDFLGILLAVGGDMIGDCVVVPPGVVPTAMALPEPVKDFSQISFWEEFYGQISRTSSHGIAGVQEKLSHASFNVRSSKTKISKGILKLNPEKYKRLVENESFFLRVAKGCGFSVNAHNVVTDTAGESGLLVQRFDQDDRADGSQKLHQEDMCQVLDELPSNKYDIPFRRVMNAVFEYTQTPIVQGTELLARYVFAWVMGNSDLHAKNVSLLWYGKDIRLSPCYDIVSQLPYQQLKQNMSMAIDGRDLNFRRRDFIEIGRVFELPVHAVELRIDAIVRKFEPWISKFEEIGYDEKTTIHVQRECMRRLNALRS